MSRNEPFESVPMANDHPDQAISLSQALLAPRIVIEDTQPVLEAGTFAAKAISGQPVAVSSKVYSDGHDRLAVMLNWRQAHSRRWHCVPMHSPGNDLWLAEFTPTELGPHLFSIEAWIDPFATYCHDLEKKYHAGVEVRLELEEGRLMLGKGVELCNGALREELQALQQRLPTLNADDQVALFLDPATARLMSDAEHRSYLARSREFPVDVDRPAAQFASWYELFPRSVTDSPERHGTFNDVHERLPMIRDMGFDVLYFPPIHPIGMQHRKGRNNALTAEPGDPGSPYAIGSAEGGHGRFTHNWAAATTSAAWWPRRPSMAWKSPSTSRSSAPRTTPGSRSTPAGSAGDRMAPSAMPRTRRRNTRTSSTSIFTRPRPYPRCGWLCVT